MARNRKLPPYRLGLAVGIKPRSENPKAEGYDGYIGWAAVPISEAETPELPKCEPEEVAVIVYDDPADMLEPMSSDEFRRRLDAAKKNLPPGFRIVEIRFDKGDYQQFLHATGRCDSHASRAKWASDK